MTTSPIAVNDFATTKRNQPVIINVVGNDSDADGDLLSAQYVPDGSLNGGLINNLDGTFTYIPPVGFVGTTTFVYRVFDGTFFSNDATVSIDVINTPPVASDDAVATNQNTPFTFSVIDNDTDADGDALFAVELLPVSRTPSLGVLVRSESDDGTAQGIYA